MGAPTDNIRSGEDLSLMGMEKTFVNRGYTSAHITHTILSHKRLSLLFVGDNFTRDYFSSTRSFPSSIFDTQATHLIFLDPFSLLSLIRHQTPFAD